MRSGRVTSGSGLEAPWRCRWGADEADVPTNTLRSLASPSVYDRAPRGTRRAGKSGSGKSCGGGAKGGGKGSSCSSPLVNKGAAAWIQSAQAKAGEYTGKGARAQSAADRNANANAWCGESSLVPDEVAVRGWRHYIIEQRCLITFCVQVCKRMCRLLV